MAETKGKTETQAERERELDRSVLSGMSYMGSKPATAKDAVDNLKRLAAWASRPFRPS